MSKVLKFIKTKDGFITNDKEYRIKLIECDLFMVLNNRCVLLICDSMKRAKDFIIEKYNVDYYIIDNTKHMVV